MTGAFVHGKRTGQWLSYWDNGRLFSRSSYIDGLLEGTCEYFHEDGSVDEQDEFVHGKRVEPPR
jgi:hypothetical protein